MGRRSVLESWMSRSQIGIMDWLCGHTNCTAATAYIEHTDHGCDLLAILVYRSQK